MRRKLEASSEALARSAIFRSLSAVRRKLEASSEASARELFLRSLSAVRCSLQPFSRLLFCLLSLSFSRRLLRCSSDSLSLEDPFLAA